MAERGYVDQRTGAHPFDRRPNAEQPTIFLITVDMIPPEAHDPRHPLREHLRTPNMDRLFAEGTRFSHAYACSPLCGPSRAAYLTGRYPYLTANEERAHDGWETALRASDAIFPEYLRATGYVTRHVGKCHVGAAKFTDAFGENDTPWDRWAPPLTDDDGYIRYLRQLGVQPPVWPAPLAGLRPDGKTPGNSYGGVVTQADGSPFPEEATYSQYLAWLATDTLRGLRDNEAGPIYLQLDFFAPHQPFLIPAGYEERARELAEVVRLPQSYHEAMRGGALAWPYVYRLYGRNWGLYDEATAARYMVMNLLQIEALDAAVGRFLAALDEAGLYDGAAIIFAGDHGEMNCERGLIDKGVYGHPKVARVPLAVKLPGGEGAGRTFEGLVSLLDIAPTVFELTGIAPTERLDGESMLPAIRGQGAARARPLLFECHWHVGPNPAISLLTDIDGRRMMYTHNLTTDQDELYDLDDPAYTDRSRDEDWVSVKRGMVQELGRVLEGDRRWACYWHAFRLARYEALDVQGGDLQMFRPE
jgi:arylsulfatase A-like enzyme